MLRYVRLAFVLTYLGLTACDVWPTVIQNKTTEKISVQYKHKDYDFWSSMFDVTPGKATSLARGHWAKDIQGMKIWDDTGVYVVASKELRDLHAVCDTAPTCYIIYYGRGHARFSRVEPADVQLMTMNDVGPS